MEINDILQSFEIYDKKYKRREIDAALVRQKEITPYLISVLENVLQNPQKYIDDDKYWGHMYAYILLGYFKESTAHDVIIDLFSLPGNLPSDLFGDSVTVDLPVVLLRTCSRKTCRIKELILNKNAYEYCRGSALEALNYAAIEGYITREEVLSFYKGLFTGYEASSDSVFHDILATCVHDLYPEELIETIKKAYENRIIHSGYIAYTHFEEVLRGGKEKCLLNLSHELDKRQLKNIHDSMSWWACFEQPRKTLSSNKSDTMFGSKLKPGKKNSKSKKKQIKASKKVNRKKKK
ncbi:MAG: DUF1186 domain-containing protein [Candidatus Anammoxibacter sp.]